MQVKSSVTLNLPRIRQLTQAAITALEQTGEALHTEVVQAQVMPFDTGHLEEDATFVDYSDSADGIVRIVSSTPYARRLYYHPEYNFQTDENPFAGGEWFEPWLPGGVSQDFAKDAFKRFYKKAGGL
nr:MAG TPA: Minor capsid protein [Caudoviricetes sp.]